MGFIDNIKDINLKLNRFKETYNSLPEKIQDITMESIKSDEFINGVLNKIQDSTSLSNLLSKISEFENNQKEINKLISIEGIKEIIKDNLLSVLQDSDFKKDVIHEALKTYGTEIEEVLKIEVKDAVSAYDIGSEVENKLKTYTKEYVEESFNEISSLKIQAQLSLILLNLALKMNLLRWYMPEEYRHYQKGVKHGK